MKTDDNPEWNVDDYREQRDKDPVVKDVMARLTEAIDRTTKALSKFGNIAGEYKYLDASWDPQPVEPKRMAEAHQIGDRSVLTHTHDQCVGRNCVIHNPSDHWMRGWEKNYRADTGRVERVCKHGIGHPDPDDVAYWLAIGKTQTAVTTHGCDGCCGLQIEVPDLPQ